MKVAVAAFVAAAALAAPADDEWLSWTRSQAVAIGERAYVRGRVGGWFDTRMLKTERSYNYKLAATLLSPEVVRASARVIQLAERLSDEEGRALLGAAVAIPGIIVMVEIDPREGSGVIPNDWLALLRPVLRSGDGRTVRGVDTPALRNVRALNGVLRRNYDYDRFWVVFPSAHEDSSPLFPADTEAVELVVRISGQEGRVRWPLPASFALRRSS